MTVHEYKRSIQDGVRQFMGVTPAVKVNHADVEVCCHTNGKGITYNQIIALRNLFKAEFNIEFDATDGVMSEAGTWWPGEKTITFMYQRPKHREGW